MGLLDVINGMQQGPRGPSTPSNTESRGGMSPMTMAVLGLLAWKAFKHFTSNQPDTTPAPTPGTPGGGTASASAGGSAGGGGGLGDVFKGSLGGLLGGAAAGSVISGGLGDLVKQLQHGGHGDAANSWVGKGSNKPIAPGDLASALGADQIDQLSSQSGLSRDDLLQGLSQYLPKVIDHLTPDGRVPTDDEVSGRL